MAATSSESVETITDSNTPLSSAGAIVCAIAGWPASGLTFFPGTRFEPWRAGIRATADGFFKRLRIVIDIDRFQIGVDVERLRAASHSGLPQAAKRHVRLAAVGAAVHHGDPA